MDVDKGAVFQKRKRRTIRLAMLTSRLLGGLGLSGCEPLPNRATQRRLRRKASAKDPERPGGHGTGGPKSERSST